MTLFDVAPILAIVWTFAFVVMVGVLVATTMRAPRRHERQAPSVPVDDRPACQVVSLDLERARRRRARRLGGAA